MLKKLYVQISHYTLSSALSALAGTISFPFLTRMLTVGEYGLLSLVSTTLELLVGVGKMGTQHSIVRFHGEADTGKGPTDIKGFYSTLSYAALLAATTWFSQRELAAILPWGALVKAGLLALGMYLVVGQIDAGGRLLTLAARVAAGVLFYGAALLAVDRPTREQARQVLERLRSRSRRA